MAITIVNSGVQTINPSGSTSIKDTTLKVTGSATGSAGAAKLQFTGISLSPNLPGATSPQHTIAKGGVPVNTFTQADINAGTISYIGYSPNVLIEYITVRYSVIDMAATPPVSKSGSFQLRYPIPDRSPEGTPGDWNVPKNKDDKAGNGQFNWTDLKDPPSQIIFVVQDVLLYGDLYYKGVKQVLPGKPFTFTQDDVNKGFISYKSFETVAQNEDYLVFKVRDSSGNWSGLTPGEVYKEADANVYRMKIIIQDKPLTVVKDKAEVDKCATITLGNDVFRSEDEDDPGLVITYTLLPNSQEGYNVRFGKLKKGGSPITPGTTWTQQDIDNGLITYEQGCTDDPEDTFHFSVKTTKNEIKDHKYTIALIPDYAPVVDITPLDVPQCETVVIGKNTLKITDPEGFTPDKIVVYMDPSKPLPLHGIILFNGTPLSAGTKFTYADILAGKLAYQHDCTEHDPAKDEFNFVVEDANNKNPYVLPINIKFPINNPPYMKENPCHRTERVGEVVWNTDKFLFADDDTKAELVTLQFTAQPKFGEFYIDGSPMNLTTVYKLSEWKGKQFRYVSKNPSLFDKEDSVPFVLNDDRAANKQEDFFVCITFPPPPIICPTIINERFVTSFQVIKAITEIDLFATTEGLTAKDMVFTLTKAPVQGTLMKNGTAVIPNDPNLGIWTAQDIKDMKLSYAHTRDTTPTKDEFEFTVTNGFCSITNVFVIDFLPGLEIDRNIELEVQQGETGTVDAAHLHAKSGQVSSDDQLKFTVTATTTLGKLFINGVEFAAGTNDKFTQADINAGLITYTPFTDQFEDTRDYFDFSVTDGFQTRRDRFKILIILEDLPPEVVINPLVVGEETCATINWKHINVKDRDSTDAQLKFTLKTNTIWGDLYLNNEIIGDDKIETQVFTYDQLVNGSLTYCETEVGALLDSFDFVITDAGGNVTETLTLPITIVPPPPPTLVNTGMIVDACRKVGITSLTLGLADLKASRDKSVYVFTVKEIPTKGYLTKNGVQLAVSDTFTLLDIQANQLAYTGITYRTEVPDAFKFDLVGPDVSYLNQTYTIAFRPKNNPPWVCKNKGIDLFENETKTISINMLQMCDVDLDYDSIVDDDPESVEDPTIPKKQYNLGAVITTADVDTTGKANKIVNIQFPGQVYSIDFAVTVGSARLYVRDQSSKIIGQSGCQEASSGPQTVTFTPGPLSDTISVQVVEGCVSGVSPAQWTVNMKKV